MGSLVAFFSGRELRSVDHGRVLLTALTALAIFLVSFGGATASAQTHVVSSTPAPYALNVSPSASVQLHFSAPLIGDSVNSRTIKIAGTMSGPHAGSYGLSGGNTSVNFSPSVPFIKGEVVSISVSQHVLDSASLFVSPWFSYFTVRSDTATGTFGSRIDMPTARDTVAHTSSYYGQPTTVCAADLNGDGYPDMIVSNTNIVTFDFGARFGYSIGVFMNNGDGTFAPVANYLSDVPPGALTAADLNGDGTMDLVVAYPWVDSLAVMFNQGNGTFSHVVNVATGQPANTVVAADIDGDGNVDLAISTSSGSSSVQGVYVFWNNGDETFSPPTILHDLSLSYSGFGSLNVADINQDGLPDLVAVHYFGVVAFRNLGNRSFGAMYNVTPPIINPPSVILVTVGDFNGDGYPDLATATEANGGQAPHFEDVQIFINNHDNTFTPGGYFGIGRFQGAMVAADLNGDGSLDLAVACIPVYGPTDTVSVLLNNGDGTFSPTTNYTFGSGHFGIAAGNFSGKGNMTLAVTTSDSGIVTIMSGTRYYGITATPGPNGTITPPGKTNVAEGDSLQMTITPAFGYAIDSVFVDGTFVGNGSQYLFANIRADHAISAQFIVAPSFAARYRSFEYDSLVVAKPVKKKALTEHWHFQIANTTGGTLTEVNLLFKNDVKEFLSVSGGFVPAKVGKVWQFTGGSLPPSGILDVVGRSTKAKPQMISKLWLGPVDATPDASSLISPEDYAELPMPNMANVRGIMAAEAGLSKGSPWVIGRQADPTLYGWAALGKGDDIYKSLIDKSGLHTQTGHGFQYMGLKRFLGGQPVIPPSKHNDRTFADLLALKFAILTSQLGITTPGFGELRIDKFGSPFHHMLVRDVSSLGDSMMTYTDPFRGSDYAVLDSMLVQINASFSGPLDTLGWGDSLKLAGARALIDVPLFYASGIAPSRVTPKAGWQEALALEDLPRQFALEQNFPNPFNPTTTIRFSLPAESFVTLKVYNMLGQEVATLLNRQDLTEGVNEVNFDAGRLASGVYFYRLIVDGIPSDDESVPQSFTSVKKMLLMK